MYLLRRARSNYYRYAELRRENASQDTGRSNPDTNGERVVVGLRCVGAIVLLTIVIAILFLVKAFAIGIRVPQVVYFLRMPATTSWWRIVPVPSLMRVDHLL